MLICDRHHRARSHGICAGSLVAVTGPLQGMDHPLPAMTRPLPGMARPLLRMPRPLPGVDRPLHGMARQPQEMDPPWMRPDRRGRSPVHLEKPADDREPGRPLPESSESLPEPNRAGSARLSSGDLKKNCGYSPPHGGAWHAHASVGVRRVKDVLICDDRDPSHGWCIAGETPSPGAMLA